MIAAIMSFIREVFIRFWEALQKFFVEVLQWFLYLLNDIGVFCVNIFYGFLSWCVSMLPDVPKMPHTGAIPELFGTANYYFPVAEGLALFALWGAVVAALAAYKGAKFVRGGG